MTNIFETCYDEASLRKGDIITGSCAQAWCVIKNNIVYVGWAAMLSPLGREVALQLLVQIFIHQLLICIQTFAWLG